MFLSDKIFGFFTYLFLKAVLRVKGYRKLKPYEKQNWHHNVYLFTAEDNRSRKVMLKTSGIYNAAFKEYKALTILNKYECMLVPIAYHFMNFVIFSVTVMQFIEGNPLHNDSVSKIELKRFFEKLALQLNHSKIVHRDIRPVNILVSKTKQIYLIDFGWAVFDGDNSSDLGQDVNTLLALGDIFKLEKFSWNDGFSMGKIYFHFFGERIKLVNSETIELSR